MTHQNLRKSLARTAAAAAIGFSLAAGMTAPALADDSNLPGQQEQITIFTPGHWQQLGVAGDANRLSLETLAKAEELASAAAGRPVTFCKVREADGSWWTNLIDCKNPERGLPNRMQDYEYGVMMPGLVRSGLFGERTFAMAYHMDAKGIDRQLTQFVRKAHTAITAKFAGTAATRRAPGTNTAVLPDGTAIQFRLSPSN